MKEIIISLCWCCLIIALMARNKLTEIDRDYYKELLEIYRNAWRRLDE